MFPGPHCTQNHASDSKKWQPWCVVRCLVRVVWTVLLPQRDFCVPVSLASRMASGVDGPAWMCKFHHSTRFQAQSTLDARSKRKQMESAEHCGLECSHWTRATTNELPATLCVGVKCGLGLSKCFVNCDTLRQRKLRYSTLRFVLNTAVSFDATCH